VESAHGFQIEKVMSRLFESKILNLTVSPAQTSIYRFR
jgi:hypothetical protein